jgi:hypothetical protein
VQPAPEALIGYFATNHSFWVKLFGQLATP